MPRFLIVAAAVLFLAGCFPREMSVEERTSTYTITHPMVQKKAYEAAELWVAENFASAKAVIDVRQPDAGLLLGKGVLRVQNAGGFGDPALADIVLKIANNDRTTRFDVTLSEGSYTDGQLKDVATKADSMAATLAQALTGTVTTRPARAAAKPAPEASPAP